MKFDAKDKLKIAFKNPQVRAAVMNQAAAQTAADAVAMFSDGIWINYQSQPPIRHGLMDYFEGAARETLIAMGIIREELPPTLILYDINNQLNSLMGNVQCVEFANKELAQKFFDPARSNE